MNHHATDIGSPLRRAREQRGLTLQDIARTTKIPIRSLDAIEHGDFERLPGGIFRKAYIRTFAAAVGVDGNELAAAYASVDAVDPAPPDRRVRPAMMRSMAAPARLFTTSLGVAALVGFLMARPAQLIDVTEAGPSPAGGGTDMLSGKMRDSANEVALASATDTAREQVVRLELRATGPSWIHAIVDGRPEMSRLLQPGEHALIEAHESITLRVGDAGAVDYSLNGDGRRTLGRRGETVTVRVVDGGLLRS
jgi:transcriptional regulator with XRE-family HTH domain